DAEMLGDGRLRHAGVTGDDMHVLLAVTAQPLEDRPAGRIGKRLEERVGAGVHDQIIIEWLWVGQPLRADRTLAARQGAWRVGSVAAAQLPGLSGCGRI